jgi:hypothetical protein
MAKSTPAVSAKSHKHDDWEVHDAMHTMMRAGEIVKDKKLMGLVRTKAKEHATKMQQVASQASSLAKRGLISEKAMSKMQGRKAKAANAGNQGGKIADLDKTRSIA